MGTALVIGLLVAMCGGIAYIGDLLGRRMGKKRLSLFNLRPRHTAVVFTVVTGMVIAAVTLGALMLASAGVRVAVTRGEQLLHDNHRLKRERRGLDLQRRQLIARNDGLETANGDLARHNTALREEGTRLRADAARLQQGNETLRAKNQSLSERSAHLTAQNVRLLQRNQTLITRNHSLVLDNARLTRANQELVIASADLKARNRRLQIATQGLDRARRVAQEQLRRTQGELVRTNHDLIQAKADLKQTSDHALRVTQEMRPQNERAVKLQYGTIIVHVNEELSRRVIPADASEEAVRDTIEKLLDEAETEVARREERAPGRVRRLRLVAPNARPDPQLEATVARLMTEKEPAPGRLPAGPMPEMPPLVLRAVARVNAAAGVDDPVEVAVVGRPDRLVFRRGEEVAKLDDVDPATTTGQLLKRLVTFLQKEVRKAAVERSVLPDAAGRVGEIDYESLMEVVGKVKRTRGRVRVGAVAAADAWTAGPLRLDFYVVPAEARASNDKPE